MALLAGAYATRFSDMAGLWLFLSVLLSTVTAHQHRMFIGNQHGPATIHSVVFDEATGYMWEDGPIAANSSHAWLAFNIDITRLYGASLDSAHLTTYGVVNSSFLQQTTTLEARGRCANTTSGYVIASRHFPNYVFSSSSAGDAGAGGEACGQSAFVDPAGDLRGVAASWPYTNRSVVGGLELGRSYSPVLYSADQGVDAVWTHTIGLYGEMHFIGRYNVPRGSGPRHLAAHAFGKYLHAVMATTSQVVPYLLDPYTGVVRYNDTAYSLLLPGYNAADFVAADLKLARSETYLWAATRAKNSTATGVGGFLSGFLLDDDGGIVKKMFTVPRSAARAGPAATKNGTSAANSTGALAVDGGGGGGGGVQALAPATWGTEWAALTDASDGSVEMWQMVQGRDTSFGTDYQSARLMGRLDIQDGGCCGNGVWFN